MKNLIARVLIAFALAPACSSLVSAQEPSAETTDDVARISTNLVQLDVAVTDRRGRTVTDLRPDEIEVIENGRSRTLTNFSFVSVARSRPTRSDNPMPGGFAGPAPSKFAHRIFVLVVDDLALSFESMKRVRIALTRFLDEQMTDGDVVTIIRTGGGPQRLTTDKETLREVVRDLRWDARGHEVGRGGPSSGNTEDDQEIGDALATASLTSLNKIVKAMGAVPGRKSIIFFSDGFALTKTNRTGFSEAGRVVESIRRIADSANRASVVVHTVEARALDPVTLTAADPGKGPQRGAFDVARRQMILDDQEGLRFLASASGGLSIRNTNDINGGVSRILEQQGYYLVGYEPDEETFDPAVSRFNKIEIKIRRPGCTALYRSGFYNEAK